MNFAIVGTGYVADSYLPTLENHPMLQFSGAWDRSPGNLSAFLRRWPARQYRSFEQLLEDPEVKMVLNLTNPRSHFEVTRRCLEAGKHVYSEKPLGMTPREALALAALAKNRNLQIACAPCSMLSETAQTLWRAVRRSAVGKVRLVYANFDDGMIAPAQQPWNWRSESGIPWPAKDEFEIGCCYEHAGYVLTWLAAMFGPAESVTAFASCQLPDKGIPVDGMAPDFTVGCIEYPGGVVARVTVGLVAPRDKSLTVVGDEGTLFVGNVRNDIAPVFLRPSHLTRMQSAVDRRIQWLHRWLESRWSWPGSAVLFQKRLPLARKSPGVLLGPGKPVDFLRGPAELAEAIMQQRPCRLSAELGIHVVEIIETLQYPDHGGVKKRMTTTFAPIQPMEWAKAPEEEVTQPGHRTIRVAHLPVYAENPYQPQLMGKLRANQVAVTDGGAGGNFFRAALLRWKPDIMHFHWLHPYLLRPGWLASNIRSIRFLVEIVLLRLAGVKVVWTVHNLVNHDERFPMLERFYTRLFARLATGVVFHSQAALALARESLGINGNKLTAVIPQGNYIECYPNQLAKSECRQLLNLKESQLVFAILGRMEPYKGILELIQCFHQMPPEAHLVIAGHVSSPEMLERIRASIGGATNIHLHEGFVPDDRIQVFLNAADAYVFPVRNILNSGSISLAMSFGLPCIAPRLGGVPENLGENGGIIYDPNQPGGLMEALGQAVQQRSELARYGRANLERARVRTWDRMAAQTAALYRRCLERF
jgi:predicted dehydrogenase